MLIIFLGFQIKFGMTVFWVWNGVLNMEKNFFVYIFASGENGTLYVGVTSNLPKRVYEHKNKLIEGFTKKYNVDKLVYYENHDSAESAILREKKLKAWRRSWKLDLTYKFNPYWEDLYENIACFS